MTIPDSALVFDAVFNLFIKCLLCDHILMMCICDWIYGKE